MTNTILPHWVEHATTIFVGVQTVTTMIIGVFPSPDDWPWPNSRPQYIFFLKFLNGISFRRPDLTQNRKPGDASLPTDKNPIDLGH